jgi:sulfonate transport system substrate-binding protein
MKLFSRIAIAHVLTAVAASLLMTTIDYGHALAGDEDLSAVTLRVADQGGALQSKLKFAGLLEGIPYRIEWAVFPAAVNIHEALKAGAVDIGLSGTGPTVSAIAGGSPIEVVAAWDTGGRGVYLLVPKESAIQSLQDLRGKTISPTGRGSAGHYITIVALEQAGLSYRDVNLAFLDPADASAAFLTGQIDAWGIWGVHAIRALGTHKARILVDTTQLRPEIYVASATRAAIEDPAKRLAVQDFIDRVERGRTWTREHRDGHIDWFAAFAKQDMETSAKSYEDEVGYRRLPVDDALVANLQETLAIWVRGGALKGEVDMTKYVFRGIQIR